MAYPLALNTDKFLSGGAMDAPDLQVRTAMNKLAWGMPISAKDAQRITERQRLEQQSIQTAQNAAQMQQMRQAGPIDVRSYTGSMWATSGPMAAQPIEGYVAPKRYNPEATADLILKQNFGGMQPGSLQIAYGGSREGQSETVPPEMMVPATETGEPIVSQTQVPEVKSVIPKQSALGSLLGSAATGPAGTAQSGYFQPSSSKYPVGSALAFTTPRQLENEIRQANYNQRVDKLKAENARKQGEDAVKSLAARHAMGEDISTGLGLTEDTNLIARATTQGRELANKIRSGEVREQEFVDGNTVYKALVNVNTGKNEGPVVPVRSTERLPGSAPEQQFSGQLEPVINPVTKQPLPDVFRDPVTGRLVHSGQLSPNTQLLSSLGLGGVATQPQQPQQSVQTGKAKLPSGWSMTP